MIDERFAEQTDKRDLDEAITPTDLWWVVLGDAREAPRLQVSVQWPSGASRPSAVGMNWEDAGEIVEALDRGGDPGATLVWVPADLSVLVSGKGSSRTVTPIAARDDLASFAGARAEPTSVREYSQRLHDRLKELKGFLAEPGAGGGGVGTSSPSSVPLPVGLIAVVVFAAVTGGLILRDRRRLAG